MSSKNTTTTATTKQEAPPVKKEAPKEKSYGVETFKTPLTKEETAGFEKLSKEEQKKFVIKRWLVENQSLDKKDAHEISAEDEQLVRVPTP